MSPSPVPPFNKLSMSTLNGTRDGTKSVHRSVWAGGLNISATRRWIRSTPADQNAISILEAEGKAPATLNRYKAALSAVFAYMWSLWPQGEPLSGSEAEARRQCPYSLLVDRWVGSIDEGHQIRQVESTSYAGSYGIDWVRRGELIGLKWSDINFSTRTAHLAVTKNGSQRVLSLTDDLLAELSRFHWDRCMLCSPSFWSQPTFYRVWLPLAGSQESRAALIFISWCQKQLHAGLLTADGAAFWRLRKFLGHKSNHNDQRYSHLCNAHKAKLTDRVFGNLVASK